MEQVASIADILNNPDLETARHCRAILAMLDNLASSQFGLHLPYWAQQSYVQHKQYTYLVPLVSDLQSRIADSCVKYAAIKAKRTSLEYL